MFLTLCSQRFFLLLTVFKFQGCCVKLLWELYLCSLKHLFLAALRRSAIFNSSLNFQIELLRSSLQHNIRNFYTDSAPTERTIL